MVPEFGTLRIGTVVRYRIEKTWVPTRLFVYTAQNRYLPHRHIHLTSMRGWIKGKWVDLRDRFTRRFIIARLRRRRPNGKSTKHEQTEEDAMPTTWHRELPPDPHPPPAQSASPSPSASQFPLPPESMSESAVRHCAVHYNLVRVINFFNTGAQC